MRMIGVDPITVVGVDCATRPKKVGLATAEVSDKGTRVIEARLGTTYEEILNFISQSVGGSKRALLALDSPLGWPIGLGASLAEHRAGGVLAMEANSLFRRETDAYVKRVIGKRPLDVGAERIARTARWSLGLP